MSSKLINKNRWKRDKALDHLLKATAHLSAIVDLTDSNISEIYAVQAKLYDLVHDLEYANMAELTKNEVL